MRPLPLLAAAGSILVLAAGGWLAIDAAAQRAAPSEPGLSSPPSELNAFEQRVRNYLLKHPEVIMEALRVLQERQRAAEAEDLRRTIKARGDEILNDAASPVGGDPAGDVTLVEFFDYNCPYCRDVAPTLAELERADPELRLVYKEFPILGAGSEFAARAALAARKQGRYVPFHRALMAADGRLERDQVLGIARAVGLDMARLEADMADPAIAAAIARNRALAGALGITGTPGFVIGETIIPGLVDLATLQRAVADARRADAAQGRTPGG